ncbi:MAG: hypothetical protein AAGA54_17040 [Myxococcota bacterium]
MLRTGFGVACAVFLGTLVGCTTEVDDPGLTTASAGSAAETSNDTDSGTSAGVDDTAEPTTEGQSGTSTTGPKGSTTDDPTTSESAGDSSSSGDNPTTGNPGGCGDGQVSPGEQCDGADLQGFDCASLGLGSGTLGCDDMMCTFDTSMCMSDTGGTSG